MIKIYKIAAFYNNLFRFLLKPVASFLSASIIFFTLFHNDILSNCFFGVIFIFLLGFFLTLVYYQFFFLKPAFRRVGAFYIKLSMLYAGENILLRAATQKIASSFGSVTSTQALMGTGVMVGGIVALETASNFGLAESSRIQANGLDRDANRFEEENLPNMAALCRAQSDMVRANEASRYPGGPITASVCNNITATIDSWNPAPTPVPDSDKIQQVSRLERLKSLQEAATIENEQQKEELRRRTERLSVLAERGRKEEEMGEQKEYWESLDAFSKGYIHLNRAASTISEVSDRLSQSDEGNIVRQALTTRVVRGLSSIFIGRIEIHQTLFPLHEKSLLTFDDKSFDNQSSKKTSFLSKIIEESANSTKGEDNLIGAYYTNDNQNSEEPKSHVLSPAKPINKEFWDALKEYHAELKNLEKEIEKDVKEPPQKD